MSSSFLWGADSRTGTLTQETAGAPGQNKGRRSTQSSQGGRIPRQSMRPGSQWPPGVREPTSTSPKMERGDDGRGRGRQSWNMTLDKSPHGPQVLSSSLGWCERRLSLREGSDGGAGDCDAGRKIKQENQFPGWERAWRTHGSRLREP